MTTEREGARSTGARREELTITADYNERYRLASAAPQLSVERAVFGTDYGITSFTTVSQAEKLLERLRPGASSRVLDIGTGSGWPGLYLSLRTQCEVVGCDLPLEGLRTARRRSSSDGTSSRVHLLQCSARALPFRAGSFDAIVHADVLCWLAAKLSVLRACGALLGPEGRLAFFVIHPAEALSEADYKRALSAGPRAVGTRRRGYREMLATAGFCSIEKVDLTDEYRETLGRLIDEGRQHAQELERLSSLQSFEDRQAEQRKALAAIDEGLLKRSLWVAKRSE